MTLGLDGEKLFMDAQLECSYTKGGRMLVGGIPMACGGWQSVVKGLATGFPSKAEAQKMVDDYFAAAERLGARTPWQRRVEGNVDEKLLATSGTMVMQLLGPAWVKVAETSWRAKAQRGAGLAILAIERYRLEKGGLPESLDELVKSGYLKELPMDPWSDGPLVYRRTADGYTLYSVGEDFTDDGGKPQPKDKPQDTLGCDIVFWPTP
jgi:hypothetical protein